MLKLLGHIRPTACLLIYLSSEPIITPVPWPFGRCHSHSDVDTAFRMSLYWNFLPDILTQLVTDVRKVPFSFGSHVHSDGDTKIRNNKSASERG